jgi:hypothetical protein
MKNMQGLLFEKHLKHYVSDDESKEAKSQQAGEAVSEDLNCEPRLGNEARDRLNHVCLPPLGNPVNGKQCTNCSDQED